MSSIGILAGLAFMLAVGVGDFLQSIPTRKIGRMRTLLFRHSLMLLVLVPLGIYMHAREPINISASAIFILVIGTLIYVYGYSNYLKAVEEGFLSIAAPISSAYSIVSVMLAVLFLHEPLTSIQFVAIFVILFGILLTSTDLSRIRIAPKGLKESLIAMVMMGIYFFFVGYVAKATSIFGLFVIMLLLQSLFFIAYTVLQKGTVRLSESYDKRLILVFLGMTVLYVLAWTSYIFGVSNGLISLVTPIGSLFPAVTVILASIFYHEKLVLNQKFGIGIVLLGLILISL
ncbi:MAG: DMT family transporter [Candidatus Peribacteraceae bacterium]|nr:DMT family transporter [Candidatus Peribacteraceae bacterium]